MSNNGSSIEKIAQSHGNSAVEVFYWDKKNAKLIVNHITQKDTAAL